MQPPARQEEAPREEQDKDFKLQSKTPGSFFARLDSNKKSSNIPLMRKRFEVQMTLGCTPIDQVVIPTKTRALIAALMDSLKYIYTHMEKVFSIFLPWTELIKKGKRNKAEKAIESAPAFKKLKNKHSAFESNINELEHRGLGRCPDRTQENFKRYEGLAITAYNLHKIGRELLPQRRAKAERRKAA